MSSYIFFKKDYDALKLRCASLIDRSRTETDQAAEAIRANGSNQDGAAHRMARESLQLIASQLQNMQDLLSNAEVSSPKPYSGSIQMGSLVQLKNISTGEFEWFCVASFWTPTEGSGTQRDPLYMTYNSPLAQALMGKRTGTTIQIGKAPRTTTYEIIAVEDGPYHVKSVPAESAAPDFAAPALA